jgi:ribosome-interacting GTPase 1
MPTNLPPDYFEAEKRYRAAQSVSEKIACLEEMLSIMPKHKGTDKLKADLRRRLSKLRTSPQAKKASRRDSAFRIEKEGAGQVVVIGPANVGKSSLVAALTNATPEIADSPYTTWKPTPGMMLVDNVQIQLIDTPPLDREFVEPALLDLIRRADIILLMVDLRTDPVKQLEDSVMLLGEYRIIPQLANKKPSDDPKMTYVPVFVLGNKCDDKSCDENFEIFKELLEGDWTLIPISVSTNRNLEELKSKVFTQLGIIRVYTKAPGEEPNFNAPFVMREGATIDDLAVKIHHDFVEGLKSAKVWGNGVFDGQLVSRDHLLQDGDIVELNI